MAVTERLSTIAPELVNRLTSLSKDEQRRIAVLLAQEAARRADLGEDDADGSAEEADRLDEMAFAAQERYHSGSATEREYLYAFKRARAAWALHHALESEPRTAVLEAAYETQAALGSLDGLRSVLLSILR